MDWHIHKSSQSHSSDWVIWCCSWGLAQHWAVARVWNGPWATVKPLPWFLQTFKLDAFSAAVWYIMFNNSSGSNSIFAERAAPAPYLHWAEEQIFSFDQSVYSFCVNPENEMPFIFICGHYCEAGVDVRKICSEKASFLFIYTQHFSSQISSSYALIDSSSRLTAAGFYLGFTWQIFNLQNGSCIWGEKSAFTRSKSQKISRYSSLRSDKPTTGTGLSLHSGIKQL